MCGWGPTPSTSLPTRLISAASQPAATAPKRVPSMARDKAELRRLNSKLPLDIGVSLTRRFMVLHAVGAKAPLEQIDNAAMFELTGLNLEQIVGQREQPKTRIAKSAQRRRNFRMRQHRRELFNKFALVRVIDFDAVCIRQHLHHSRTNIRERHVTAGHSEGCGIHDEVGEPKAHGALLAKNARKNRLHCLQIEKSLIDIKDDQRKRGHVSKLQFVNLCRDRLPR